MTEIKRLAEIERLARVLCDAQGWSWLDPEAAEREGNFSGDDYCDHIRAVLKAMREPSEGQIEAGDAAMDWDSDDRSGAWFVRYSDGDSAKSWQAMIDHLLEEK